MTKMSNRPQDIPVKKLISALLAISFGTIIEWVGSCTEIARKTTLVPSRNTLPS